MRFLYPLIKCEMLVNGNARSCSVLEFGCFRTHKNWCAQLRYSKSKNKWNRRKGSFTINNIDLYTVSSGNDIVSLNYPSSYWLAKQFFGKKWNLPKLEKVMLDVLRSVGEIVSGVGSRKIDLFFFCDRKQLFFLFFFFLLTFSSGLRARPAAAVISGIPESKNFTSLHHLWRNTVHNFRTRATGCVEAIWSNSRSTSVGSSVPPTWDPKNFVLRVLNSFRRLECSGSCQTQCSLTTSLNPHPYTACLPPPPPPPLAL